MIYKISDAELNLIKDNIGLKRKNNKLNRKNKKLSNKLDFYKKLLNTKPYRFAKLLRNLAKKIRN